MQLLPVPHQSAITAGKKKLMSEDEKEKDKDNKQEDKEKVEQPAEPVEQAPISRVVPDMSAGDGSSPVDVEVDPITAAAKQTKPIDSKIGTLEKIFSVVNIDKSLSLLAAILPQELSVGFMMFFPAGWIFFFFSLFQ